VDAGRRQSRRPDSCDAPGDHFALGEKEREFGPPRRVVLAGRASFVSSAWNSMRSGDILRRMRIACLQHASFEGPGMIAEWARERAHSIETIHLYNGNPLPVIDSFDLLLVMGGPMSVNDESGYGWLAPEKQLIRQCLFRRCGQGQIRTRCLSWLAVDRERPGRRRLSQSQ
jgi:hypothetical protein